MLVQMFKSKLHRATVTQADLNYMGSITIDETLMEAANLLEGERVQIVNNNNGGGTMLPPSPGIWNNANIWSKTDLHCLKSLIILAI
jgi:hypothetical protein